MTAGACMFNRIDSASLILPSRLASHVTYATIDDARQPHAALTPARHHVALQVDVFLDCGKHVYPRVYWKVAQGLRRLTAVSRPPAGRPQLAALVSGRVAP